MSHEMLNLSLTVQPRGSSYLLLNSGMKDLGWSARALSEEKVRNTT